jgi:hypothetical protein
MNGQYFLYNTTNFNYALKFLADSSSWVNNRMQKGNFFNGSTDDYVNYAFSSLFLIAFGSTANNDPANWANIKVLINPILNSGLNLDNDTQLLLKSILDDMVTDKRFAAIIDPTQVANAFPNLPASGAFSQAGADINTSGDTNIGFDSSSGGRRRFLELARQLVATTKAANATNTTKPAIGVNSANPRCTFPVDVTSKLSGSKLWLTFIRDPSSFNANTNATKGAYINSQVLQVVAKDSNKNQVAFPSTTTPFNCKIPFANTPLSCPNGFTADCKVLTLVNNTNGAGQTWVEQKGCNVTADTNGTTAYVNINGYFGTFGVSCSRNCKVNATAFATAAKRTNTSKTAGSFLYISSIVSSLLAFILF